MAEVRQEIGYTAYDSAKFDKLRLEIQELKSKENWRYKVGQCTPMITALLAIAAFWVGIQQFNSQQSQNALIQEQTSERDFKKPVWDRQLALYYELSCVVATIATSPPGDEAAVKAETRFRELYWGPAVLAEDKELKDAMTEFNICLNGWSEVCKTDRRDEELKRLSLQLAIRCRKSMGITWEIPIPELYRPDLYRDVNQKRELP